MARNRKTSAAIFTVYGAADMSDDERSKLVAWMTRQAKVVRCQHAQLAQRYTAQYGCR